MNISTRDFAATRRFLRRRMATQIQPPANGEQLARRFLLAISAALVLFLIVRLWP